MRPDLREYVRVTSHACDRYHERVRPDLTRSQARYELKARVRRQSWHGNRPVWTVDSREPAIAWLYLGPCIALPVIGTWENPRVGTVLTEASSDAVRRERFNLEGWQSGNAAAC